MITHHIFKYTKFKKNKKILEKLKIRNQITNFFIKNIDNDQQIILFFDKKISKKSLEKYVDNIIGICLLDIHDNTYQIYNLFSNNDIHILKYLQKKYKKIWFAIPLKHLKLLKEYISIGFKSPYISKVNLSNKPIIISLCMLYDKSNNNFSIEDNYKISQNLISQYKSSEVVSCQVKITIPITTVKYLKKLVYESKNKIEKSGELYLDGLLYNSNEVIFNLKIDKKTVTKGNQKEADMVMSTYNFHTHPKAAYTYYNCDLGWPSLDDYLTYLYTLINFGTIFHIISTLEGLYVISISKSNVHKIFNIDYKKFDTELEPLIQKCYQLDKNNVKLPEGTHVDGFGNIKSGEDYSRYANQIKCGKYNNLFSVNFSSWDNLSNPNLLTFFKIHYPKKDGNCALDTQ